MGISYAEYQTMLKRQGTGEADAGPKLPRAKRAKPRPPGPFMRKYRAEKRTAREACPICGVWSVYGKCQRCAAIKLPYRCLAIDPSITRLGFHVADSDGSELASVETGVWAPSGAEDAPDRWEQITCFTTALLKHFAPTDVVVEMPHAHQSEGRGGQKRGFKSLMIYSVGVGMVAGVIASQRRRLWRPDANQWKGTSKKYDTLTFVELTMGLRGLSADEADAAGLAWWWYQYILPSLATTTPLTFRPPF
jgi:Holliday junction resolvasome RuvABC endonuclease subunit